MKPSNLNPLASVAIACLVALPAYGAGSVLNTRLAEAIRGGHYQPPDNRELERVEAVFLRLAKGVPPADIAADLSELALEAERDGVLVVVRERGDARRGRGFFVFRQDARPDVLQIPHGFKDEMTRDIGAALFAEGNFSAAIWNTVPRHYDKDGARIDADMAHRPASYFNAFTRATARAWPQGQTLQIHGFDAGKRKSAAGADADMILSNGSRTPGDRLRHQTRCLSQALKQRIALYPDQVGELGGTTNRQGDVLRSLGYSGFVHIEISRELRNELRSSKETRSAFLRCMQEK